MRRRLARCRKGATAIEYALIASLLGVGIAGGTQLLGDNVNGSFCAVAGKMANVVGFKGTCGDGAPAVPDEPETPLVLTGYGLGIGGPDEDRECNYRFNYRSGAFDLDSSASGHGACDTTFSGGPQDKPPQKLLDEWTKGGRDDYGTII